MDNPCPPCLDVYITFLSYHFNSIMYGLNILQGIQNETKTSKKSLKVKLIVWCLWILLSTCYFSIFLPCYMVSLF